MNPKTIIFIGRSGCGKGTQVDQLREQIKKNDNRPIFHLEAGERFRNFIKEGNYSSELAKQISNEGGLQPEFLSVWAWSGELIKNMQEDSHLLIDGTPRREIEAKVLESVFDFYGRESVDIIYLNVSREWATKRMQNRGRADDQEMKDITARLDWFDADVVPVIDFYRAHRSHLFHEINGEQNIEKVHRDILESLEL